MSVSACKHCLSPLLKTSRPITNQARWYPLHYPQNCSLGKMKRCDEKVSEKLNAHRLLQVCIGPSLYMLRQNCAHGASKWSPGQGLYLYDLRYAQARTGVTVLQNAVKFLLPLLGPPLSMHHAYQGFDKGFEVWRRCAILLGAPLPNHRVPIFRILLKNLLAEKSLLFPSC